MSEGYVLSLQAEADLTEIAQYTLVKWGEQAFEQYRNGLKQIFSAIADGSVVSRTFSESLPSVLVVKYRHHFIFYLRRSHDIPIIIGIIHEKRDIVALLAKRLTSPVKREG